MNWMEFLAATAWPIVALIALLILGPGGVLQRSVGELASKLMSIKSSVAEFRTIADNFNEQQRSVQESLNWLKEADGELRRISSGLDSVRTNTNELLLTQGEKAISDVVGEPEADAIEIGMIDAPQGQTAQERYDLISERWAAFTELIRQRIGPDRYDGRAIGQMAWKLSHRARADAISKQDAELIESLHSQFKRFGRMRTTMDDWLTAEIFDNFMRGTERAERSLT